MAEPRHSLVHRLTSRAAGASIAVLATMFAVGHAAAGEPPADNDGGIFSLVVENDGMAGTDQHYTNGVLLSYAKPMRADGGWLRQLAAGLPAVHERDEIYVAYYLGHEIYTPANIYTSRPLPDDRPYAGYLYGAIGFMAEDGEHVDAWRFSLGIVGPSSAAEHLQREFHERLGGDSVEGWDNQLRDEPALLVEYERRWRTLYAMDADGWGADLVPHAGWSLGNVAVAANVGLTLRAGWGLGTDYGPPRIRPGLPGGAYFRRSERPALYVFVGGEGRYVAHDLFLEGNTWKDSQGVETEHWVPNAHVGVVVNSGNFRFTYTHVWQDRQFDTQAEPSRFGSVGISMRF